MIFLIFTRSNNFNIRQKAGQTLAPKMSLLSTKEKFPLYLWCGAHQNEFSYMTQFLTVRTFGIPNEATKLMQRLLFSSPSWEWSICKMGLDCCLFPLLICLNVFSASKGNAKMFKVKYWAMVWVREKERDRKNPNTFLSVFTEA